MVVNSLRALWQYRGFIRASVVREVQLKYKDSVLGLWWLIGSPLVMILIYTLVFSKVMHSRLPGMDMPFAYSVYLCAGLLQWNLFAEVLGRTQGFFLDNANLIKKASFPVISLPIIATLGSGVNFFIIYALFAAFMLYQGLLSASLIVLYPLVIATIVALAFTTGMILSVFNVFFRDIGQLVPLTLQLVFWATPIVYPASILPEQAQHVLSWLPLYNLMTLSHQLHLGLPWLLQLLLYPLAWVAATGGVAMLVYKRLYSEILDEI